MNIEDLRIYCLKKSHTEECFPFDEDTLVFKVAGKMFFLISLTNSDRFNVKCDPELAISLRETYSCVQPGFHMSKKHWNTIHINGTVNDDQLKEWIDHSYAMVYNSLPKKTRVLLGKMNF